MTTSQLRRLCRHVALRPRLYLIAVAGADAIAGALAALDLHRREWVALHYGPDPAVTLLSDRPFPASVLAFQAGGVPPATLGVGHTVTAAFVKEKAGEADRVTASRGWRKAAA